MHILILIFLYILNVLLNRWIFFRIGDKDKSNLENPVAKFLCFLPIIGTILLTVIWLVDSDFFKPNK